MSNTIADYFRDQAAWREEKAVEYPDDERNAQAADALRSLAEYAESTGPQVRAAVRSLEPFEYGLGIFRPGEEGARETSRYGYGHPVNDASHQEFLGHLLALCHRDAYESIVEGAGSEDGSGTLANFEILAARDGVALDPGYWRRRPTLTRDEREAWVRLAQKREEGMMAEDPLYDAEAQMVEYELAAFRDLFLRVSRHLPDADEPTEEQLTAVLREVIAEDAQARELAERIGVLQAFRSKQREQEESE